MSTAAPTRAACAGLLWDAVRAADEHTAVDVVLDAFARGLDAEALLLDVVGGVQRRVGEEWAANRLRVAEEHTATAINERVVAAVVRAAAPVRDPHRPRIAVACVDGEWHALPARLLAEVLGLRGFQVDHLGAQVPTPRLITHLHRTGPDAVALSGSIATRLPGAHATVTACQAAGVPVLVGGRAFGPDGRYARLLGADLWAPDARAAADRLAAAPLPRPRDGHQPIDDLPHLDDQEYTMVSRTGRQLVKAVCTGLEDRPPVPRGRTGARRGHAAEDVAHLVDFLAAALYTDDRALLTGFVTWTAGVLRARGVPPLSLVPALDLLTAELHDFPRATGLLAAARTALTAPAPDPDPDPGPTT